MIIHIVAGGPLDRLPLHFPETDKRIYWVGVDKGLHVLLKNHITPKKAFGDFDSVTKEEFDWINSRMTGLEIHPSEKDETDLEIALNWALIQKPELIKIFGATGGRLDHELGNIQLLYRALEKNVRVLIVDRKNELEMMKPGEYTITALEQYPYISFLPMTQQVSKLSLSGFKYPLNEKDVYFGSTLSISNEVTSEFGNVSFQNGILLMIRSTD